MAAQAPGAALHALPPRARLAAVGMAVTLAVLGGLYFFCCLLYTSPSPRDS